MADSWVKEDKELGMLPVNWLAERKLSKGKDYYIFCTEVQNRDLHSSFTYIDRV